jgi:hypothetical protein
MSIAYIQERPNRTSEDPLIATMLNVVHLCLRAARRCVVRERLAAMFVIRAARRLRLRLAALWLRLAADVVGFSALETRVPFRFYRHHGGCR